jgi:hypothetical protein
MATYIPPDKSPDGTFPTVFNLLNYKSKTGAVTFSDLLNYGSLFANNIWRGFNQFNSVQILTSINNIPAQFLEYLQYVPNLIMDLNGVSYHEAGDKTLIENNVEITKELTCEKINGIENWNHLLVTEPIQSALTSIRNSIASVVSSITNTNLDIESVRTSLNNLANSLSSYSFQNNFVKISSDIELKNINSTNISTNTTNTRKINSDSIFTNQLKSKIVKSKTIYCDEMRSKNEIAAFVKINSDVYPLTKSKTISQLTNENVSLLFVSSLRPGYIIQALDNENKIIQQIDNHTDDFIYNQDLSLQTNTIKIMLVG